MKNWKKLAVYAALGILAALLLLLAIIPAVEIVLGHAGNFLLDYTMKHPLGVTVVIGVTASILYIAWNASATPAPLPPQIMPKPSMSDYFKILETLRPAMAEIASTLGLAPIDSHTDMAADGAERILRWGRVWGFRYKARKLSTTTMIDVEQTSRIIQAQVATVLDRDNPSKLTETNYNYFGQLVPVIQIAEVKDDDAYIYIYVVMASDIYFKQVEAEKRASTIHTKPDESDTDF